MGAPRFLADEMVGRLARYLRFVGCDTLYARDWSDETITDLARREDRVVLTRDRELARRADRALLLTSPEIAEQWKAVLAAFPDVPRELAFDRCSACNGRLAVYVPTGSDPHPAYVPWERVASGLALYRCGTCDQVYWDGSHGAQLRARIAAWGPSSDE